MKVIVYGFGLMGKKVSESVRRQPDMELRGVVSYEFDQQIPEPMYPSLVSCLEDIDIIIDFSHPNNLEDILAYAMQHNTKLVLATTGYSPEHLWRIEQASKELAIFQAYNTSLGAQMVTKILRSVARELYDSGFDIEILEKHHRQKIDAPSGTAELFYEVIEEEIPEVTAIYDRSSVHHTRSKQEIGVQSMRGGTIFGEHTVLFAGIDEMIEVKHTALSKEVFVQGAISAARSLEDKDTGLYTLKTLY